MSKTITIGAGDDGQRLDRWLKNKFPTVPYAMIQKSLRTGDIRIDGKKAEGNARLQEGNELRLPPVLLHALKPAEEQTLSKREVQFIKDMVIYQDDAIIVFNKPSGLATQGGSKTLRHVDHYLQAFANKDGDRPKLVHRLDKDTSGVLVVAKTRAAAERMAEIFKYRHVDKTYLAITLNVPRSYEDTIRRPLAKAGDKIVVDSENGKAAVTDYKVLSFADPHVALVALRPETGRMHQLRVHLAHIHCPILGDAKYGGLVDDTSFLSDAARERLWLHALCLTFPHPVTGREMRFAAPVPKEMQRHLQEWHMDMEDVTDVADPKDPMEGSSFIA